MGGGYMSSLYITNSTPYAPGALGLPAGYVKLGSWGPLAAASNSKSITVPAGYYFLRLVADFLMTGAGNMILRMNTDAGANYTRYNVYGSGGAATANNNGGGNQFQIDGSNAEWTSIDMMISAASGHAHSLVGHYGTNALSMAMAGKWNSNAEIATLDFTTTANEFAIGSKAVLLGMTI